MSFDNNQIYGEVEILDKNNKTLYIKKNNILTFGKYKIISSLFQSKNEWVDGIKYLELYLSSQSNLNNISQYNDMYKVEQIQIDRLKNIEFLYFDDSNEEWNSVGNVLKSFKYGTDNFRNKFLMEKLSQPINDFYSFMNLFNMEYQCQNFNKIQIQFNIPVFRKYYSNPIAFNLLVLSYGGSDVQNGEDGPLIEENTNVVLDTNITNQTAYNQQMWTSGLPFSQINLPETFEIVDQFYVKWRIVFNFNKII